MNMRKMITLALVLSAGAFVVAQAKPTEAELTRQAVVKKAHGERIALARVPHGTIKSAEIENERGKLVWSFDIATPGTPDITEVLVNAKTGAIISVSKETRRNRPPKQRERNKGSNSIFDLCRGFQRDDGE